MQKRTKRLGFQGTTGFKKVVVFLILLFMGLIGGCMGSQAKRPVMEFYSLNYDPPVSETVTRLPLIISIMPFQGVPPYDTTRIIYSRNRFTRNIYFYHQWIAEPGEMITDLLARDIRSANIVCAVMISEDIAATHVIKGTVEAFYEQDNKEKWNAILSLTVTLIKKDEGDITKKICFQKNYTKSQTCEEKSPRGLADAMSIAMSKVSEMVIADIYRALSS
jgi:cholesterol transport system auxiliary component